MRHYTDEKTRRLLLASLLAAAVVAGPRVSEAIEIHGTVEFDDGQPVEGGTIFITDMRERFFSLFQMRRPIILATLTTDPNGEFRLDTAELKGDLARISHRRYRNRPLSGA
jgi:hypothetical protein